MSKLSLRTDRIENLFSVMNALPSHLEESTIEYAERAICRAAAEIGGLTPEMFDFILAHIDHEVAHEQMRRYAELAAEDE